MRYYPYLIVGGGMTADTAVAGIRDVDRDSPVGIIGAELDPPFNRPPMSKRIWKGKPEAEIRRDIAAKRASSHLFLRYAFDFGLPEDARG